MLHLRTNLPGTLKSLIDHELSSNLRQAILAEVGKAVTETKALLEEQIVQTSDQLDEAHEALAEQEKALSDSEQELKKLTQQIAVSDKVQAQLAEKVQHLEKKLEQSIQGTVPVIWCETNVFC